VAHHLGHGGLQCEDCRVWKYQCNGRYDRLIAPVLGALSLIHAGDDHGEARVMPDEWPVDGQVLRYRPAVRPIASGRAGITHALCVLRLCACDVSSAPHGVLREG